MRTAVLTIAVAMSSQAVAQHHAPLFPPRAEHGAGNVVHARAGALDSPHYLSVTVFEGESCDTSKKHKSSAYLQGLCIPINETSSKELRCGSAKACEIDFYENKNCSGTPGIRVPYTTDGECHVAKDPHNIGISVNIVATQQGDGTKGMRKPIYAGYPRSYVDGCLSTPYYYLEKGGCDESEIEAYICDSSGEVNACSSFPTVSCPLSPKDCMKRGAQVMKCTYMKVPDGYEGSWKWIC